MMNYQRYLSFFFLFLLITVENTQANQKPCVVNFARDNYHAANKNWSIGQDEKGIMYFGNDIGLLESDGMEWKLYQTTNSTIVRAIAVESHQVIYSGGTEDFGRWDRDLSGSLKYTSLKNLLPQGNHLSNESFWKIWIDGNKVYFQSFSHIYVYDHHTIEQKSVPNGFFLLLKVRDEYWVQEMYGPLYRLKNGEMNKIPESDFLRGKLVRVILPYVFNYAFIWSEELSRLLFVWIVLLGAALGLSQRKHMTIDFVQRHLPRTISLWINLVLQLIGLVFILILVVKGIPLLQLVSSDQYVTLPFSVMYAYLAVVVGGVLMAFYWLIEIGHTIRGLIRGA